MRTAPNPQNVGGTVFISYSHDNSDHVRSVLTLSNKLRSEGIDCVLDQYEACPPEGWPRWMDREINKAQFVLMICTQAYYRRVMGEEKPGIGLGIAWEGSLIYNHIYASGSLNTKFIPVIFDHEHAKYIPIPIQGATRYCVSADYGYGYEQLYSRLIGKPPTEKPPLGKRKALPEREVKTDLARLLAIPFEPELWEKADWRSVVFELPEDRPPALGLGFVNEDAARQIFRQWLEWVGPRDELEELRVSIIEGDIPGQGPGYSVHVGLDAQALFERYKKMGFATDRDLLVAPGEISRQNVPNSPQLAAFREEYRIWKTYFLVPVIMNINKDGTKAFKLLDDMRIYKGKIHFRHVSEISEDEDDADREVLETLEYRSEVFTRICDIVRGKEQWPAAAAAVAVPATQPATPTLSDVFSLKPALWGMSIDLPKAWKWLRERLHSLGRKQQAMPQLPKTASILNRLWRDPVWSKVIATGITALIGSALVWYFQVGLRTQNAPPPPAQRAVPANIPSNESRTNPTATTALQAPVPDADRSIAWRTDLSFWTGGAGENGGALLLGVVIRGTITDAVPVHLTDAYIISEITGEKKGLQVEIGPGPRLSAISDINQIPSRALLQLWATFSPPGISPTDFVARWGSFRFHAEYAGLKYDKVFSREAVQNIMQLQFPEVGPHVTPKGLNK